MQPRTWLTLVGIAIVWTVLWSVRYRYDQLRVGEYTMLVRTNRLTGSSQVFRGGRWENATPLKADTTRTEQELPPAKLKEVDVSFEAASDYDPVTAKIYNGSDWTISEIEVRGESFSLLGCNGKKGPLDDLFGCPDSIWNRTYRQPMTVLPLSSQSTILHVGVTPTDAGLLKDAKARLVWRLQNARGLPPQ
jgi:hypothetical protein